MEINIDFSQNDRKKCCELAIVACSLNSTLILNQSALTLTFSSGLIFFIAFRARPQLK